MQLAHVKFIDLLSGRDLLFHIPTFQRNYRWGKDQLIAFLDDIIETYNDFLKDPKDAGHLFGTVSYQELGGGGDSVKQYVLSDGQQRITTTMLFLAAIRDCVSDKDFKECIDCKYLKNEHVRNNCVEKGGLYKVKLKQTEHDEEAYWAIINNKPLTDLKDSPICKAYNYFMCKLRGLLRRNSEQYIRDIFINGLCNFYVETQIHDKDRKYENIQRNYESQNSLAVPLSFTDMVRCYLLSDMTPEEQEENFNKYWADIDRSLSKNTKEFLNDYMIIKKKEYTKRTKDRYKLFRMFKTIFARDKDVLVATLKELSELAPLYAMIIGSKTADNKRIRRLLFDIRKLNAQSTHAFMLAVLDSERKHLISEADTISILNALRTFIFRKRLTDRSSRGEWGLFPELIHNSLPKLYSAQQKPIEFFKLINQHKNPSLGLPTDDDIRHILFRDKFGLRGSNHSFTLYTLARIEEHLTKKFPLSLDGSDNLTVEHIAPQHPSVEWVYNFGNEENYNACLENIGNLTLLTHEQNATIKDKPFDEKRTFYEKHVGYQIARSHITGCVVWNMETVEQRCRYLTELLIKQIVPVPGENRPKLISSTLPWCAQPLSKPLEDNIQLPSANSQP